MKSCYTIAFLLLALAAQAFGNEPVVRYSLLLGTDFVYSRGDLDGERSVVASGDSIVPEAIYLADIPFMVVYALDLRAHVDASSVSFNLGLGYPTASYLDTEEKARYFRLGVEYQYHFRWPEALRPGIGLGYDFSSLRIPNAAHGEYGTSYATHSGSGFHGVTSLGYYGWRRFGLEAAIRYRILGLGNVSTDANDFSELDKTLWQGLGEVGLRGIFQF